MLFKPEAVAKTWDTWVYHHADAFYLYYLISERFPGEGFGIATSQDGIAWQDHGVAMVASDKMVRYFGSGSVWEAGSVTGAGRFLCNNSEWRSEGDQNVQSILFAWSDDLLHWHKLDDSHIFRIDERWYKKVEPGARGPWEDPRWDGICVVPRPEGGYYGYWTANPKDSLGFGFGMSDDGLHWEALEPPRIEWGETPQMHFIEVGGVHLIDGQYYAMLADYATTNCGMFCFVSDTPDGPFRPAQRNYSLLSNQSRMHAYFTRFLDAPDGVLVTHHSLAEGQYFDERFVVYYAPLKKAVVVDGNLYLAWWQGNNKLKRREVGQEPGGEQARFDPTSGVVLEGTLALPGRLSIGSTGETATGILVSKTGIVEIGPIGMNGTAFKCEERVDRAIAFGTCPRFRLLINRTMLEFYLNDVFVQCYTMSQSPNGAVTGENTADLRLWQWS